MKLIFVYNAKSDLLSKTFDIAHKILSPDTYSCKLCVLTHGNFSEKESWKTFRNSIGLEMEFLYKNEAQVKYPNMKKLDFPVVLQNQDEILNVLLDAKQLASIGSTKELVSELKEKILIKNS